MNIDRIRVNGLFDRFDHDLKFRTDERVMIVTGPNGFGKTTTLRLIDMLFNQPIVRLASMPFREVDVLFDDGTNLIAVRETEAERQKGDRLPLTLSLQPGGHRKTFDPQEGSVDQSDLGFPISAIERSIPVLDQVGRREWHNNETGEILDLDGVLTLFHDDLPGAYRRDGSAPPEWLQDIVSSITVRCIDTERLTGMARPSRRGWEAPATRSVRVYSQQLARRIEESIAKYGALSQSLDRTFPARLVTYGSRSNGSLETLQEDLDSIDKKRSRLEEVGLLAGDQARMEIPDLAGIDESQRGVLAVYAQDTKDKLGVFDDLYGKVRTFMGIANARFRHKRVAVSAEGLSVVAADGANLDLEMLSSGEQHELVLLYELLFREAGNSLILIDEPELSLHVAWQEQFVKDLEETAKLSDFRAIIATHSPEIIGDRWDLTVELHGPNDD